MTILQDYVNGFKEIRAARKSGMTIKAVKAVPRIQTGYWGWTMESTIFSGELARAVNVIFDGFDEETKHALTFTPSPGEWAERARFWKNVLQPALPPSQYSAAMQVILSHYVHCARRRLEAKTA